MLQEILTVVHNLVIFVVIFQFHTLILNTVISLKILSTEEIDQFDTFKTQSIFNFILLKDDPDKVYLGEIIPFLNLYSANSEGSIPQWYNIRYIYKIQC
jgi:hypothetical protein